jgi:hypothetical protein
MHLFSGPFDELDLSVNTDMPTIVRAMARPDSGLEIRDRMWLKITIPNAFIGADVVDWLHTHVKGFIDRSVSFNLSTRTRRHCLSFELLPTKGFLSYGAISSNSGIKKSLVGTPSLF